MYRRLNRSKCIGLWLLLLNVCAVIAQELTFIEWDVSKNFSMFCYPQLLTIPGIVVSGEAILSAENSGKPLGGRGCAPSPAEGAQLVGRGFCTFPRIAPPALSLRLHSPLSLSKVRQVRAFTTGII